MTTTSFPPSITVAKLYRKTSAKGATYYTGRWGGAKIALLKSNEVADDGSEYGRSFSRRRRLNPRPPKAMS
jgi:hypothetical protein